ncbi:SDR family oxidoreductase [Flavobacterium luteum]|uniref:SDR family oxidoreductase n=1 Tax=Flavobacterium luteum TaxID=2026654 RepID=A0A7J5AH82_9FLAO|nr:SDR family oxidoreductase [Flavobacterium luteum]KAB1156982.1 SDR family oxidoreductase [Flavobacterium luteum]
MTKISILGCGWLGLPLAKSLLKKGFYVKGSTTSIEKLTVLEQANIDAFLISLHSDSIVGDIETFLKDSEILIIDIPPKLRGINNESFVGKMKTLLPYIENSSVKNVLFVSSTSVYADENRRITEETTPNPETESGEQLLQVEQLFQKNTNFKTTIVRFGGLIGEDRHPIHSLSKKDNVENPNAPINLIHQEDCIGIIEKIIEMKSWNETYNAVTPFHPSREIYYTQKAIELNINVPKFNHSKTSIGKTILSNKIHKSLDYQFIRISL